MVCLGALLTNVDPNELYMRGQSPYEVSGWWRLGVPKQCVDYSVYLMLLTRRVLNRAQIPQCLRVLHPHRKLDLHRNPVGWRVFEPVQSDLACKERDRVASYNRSATPRCPLTTPKQCIKLCDCISWSCFRSGRILSTHYLWHRDLVLFRHKTVNL